MFRYIPSISSMMRVFVMNEWILSFAKWFYNIYLDNHVIFVLVPNVVYHIDWFADI